MSRNKGTFNFAANFEVLAKAPLDARQVVATYSDLTNPSTWLDSGGNNWLYKGAIVAVSSDPSTTYNGIYYLVNDASYNLANGWIKSAATGVSGTQSINTVTGSGAYRIPYQNASNTFLTDSNNLKFDTSTLSITGNVNLVSGAEYRINNVKKD